MSLRATHAILHMTKPVMMTEVIRTASPRTTPSAINGVLLFVWLAVVTEAGDNKTNYYFQKYFLNKNNTHWRQLV